MKVNSQESVRNQVRTQSWAIKLLLWAFSTWSRANRPFLAGLHLGGSLLETHHDLALLRKSSMRNGEDDAEARME